MTNYTYTLVKDDDGNRNLTVVVPGDVLPPILETHPNWDAIFQAIVIDEADLDEFEKLLDVEQSVSEYLDSSRRITVKNGKVYIDHDEVDNSLTRQIINFMRDGLNPYPLTEFLASAYSNPNEHSRTQMFDWLARRDFSINSFGQLVAYKGVRIDENGDYWSINSGPAIVDGVAHKGGPVPNKPGSTIEMARSEVQHDPSIGCHVGLHVGTFEYARDFAGSGVVLRVFVDPRDIVSVPTDCDSAKVRCCRYTVDEVAESKHDTPLYEEIISLESDEETISAVPESDFEQDDIYTVDAATDDVYSYNFTIAPLQSLSDEEILDFFQGEELDDEPDSTPVVTDIILEENNEDLWDLEVIFDKASSDKLYRGLTSESVYNTLSRYIDHPDDPRWNAYVTDASSGDVIINDMYDSVLEFLDDWNNLVLASKVTHPDEATFESLKQRAKTRKQSFVKYATEVGKLKLIDPDNPKDIKSWSVS